MFLGKRPQLSYKYRSAIPLKLRYFTDTFQGYYLDFKQLTIDF